MQPADIGRLTAVGDPRLSPDASRVAFTVTTIDLEANEYRTAIWVAQVDGSEESAHVRRRHAKYFLAVSQRANLNSGNLGAGAAILCVRESSSRRVRPFTSRI